jgi:hypothetical protein
MRVMIPKATIIPTPRKISPRAMIFLVGTE